MARSSEHGKWGRSAQNWNLFSKSDVNNSAVCRTVGRGEPPAAPFVEIHDRRRWNNSLTEVIVGTNHPIRRSRRIDEESDQSVRTKAIATPEGITPSNPPLKGFPLNRQNTQKAHSRGRPADGATVGSTRVPDIPPPIADA